MSVFERLERSGLIRTGHHFSEEDKRLLESLSQEEAEALISVKRKLGEDFLKRNTGGSAPALGIVF
jgi:hypothetical protein